MVQRKLDSELKKNMQELLVDPVWPAEIREQASRKLPGVIVADAGIDLESKTVKLCNSCWRSIKNAQLPLFALANGLWTGPVPPFRAVPTIPEQLLVSPERPKVYVLTLTELAGPGTGQKAFKPHTIVYPQDVASIVKQLPRDVNSLSDSLKVVFVGAKLPARDDPRMQNLLAVRPALIAEMLAFFKRNNPYFDDVKIDEQELRALAAVASDNKGDSIPDSVWDNIVHVEPKSVPAEDSGPSPDSMVHQEEGGTASGIVDVDALGISDNKQAAQAASVIVVPHGSEPTRAFGNPAFYARTFPFLFPYGRGGAWSPHQRRGRLSLRQWARRLINVERDSYRKHAGFLFLTYNLVQRADLCAQARLMVDSPFFSSTARALQQLTHENVRSLCWRAVPHYVYCVVCFLQGECDGAAN
jgi:hypothetical protein